MKNLIFIAIAILFSVSTYAQTEDEQVTQIRKGFTKINANLSDYKVVEKDIEDESTEGGLIKSYYDNERLMLMRCEFYGEMGNLKEDYYFNEGKLFFVFTVRGIYSAPVYTEEEIDITTEENRYYFNNDKMIRWIDSHSVKILKTSDDFIKEGKKVFDESNRLLEVFKSY